VSKQAAHKRFTGSGPLFQRFTDRARKIIVAAEEQSRELGHTNIEPEHILLALAKAQEGLARKALDQLDVTYDQLLEKVVERTPRNADTVMPGKIPFSERSKNLLQATLEEAIGLAHNYIGTEHMLLAMHRDETSPAARFLTDLGADSAALHGKVEELLTDFQRKKAQQG
jgi:ATP-dependent Clp protease ATP-binding subunit ClpC